MFSRDRWQEIFDTIRKNKLRTFLSGFTVALGIFIFITLFGLGNGLKNTFQEFFLNDATNTILLHSGRTSKPYKGFKANRRIEFENSDLEDVKTNFPFFFEAISPRISGSAIIRYKSESSNYDTRAVGPSNQFFEKTIMMKGRYINDSDVAKKTKYAVIGRLVAQDLFGTEDPIGKYIDIGGIAFKVIGVFQDKGGDQEERIIYIPYTTHQKLKKGSDKVDDIIVSFRPNLNYAGVMDFEAQLIKFLREKKSVDPSDRGGLHAHNLADSIKQNQQFVGVLQIIVAFIGLGTLIAGIIGISNIMVFVVKERTKELGIRKALGATPRSVINMILQESVFITTLSGFVGLFLGVLLLGSLGVVLEEYSIKNPYIDVYTAFLATAMLIVFGGIAGYIPAKRAAKIKPIIALRDA